MIRRVLSQENLPRLWYLYQKVAGFIFGGNGAKKDIVRNLYGGETELLEIGCSVGLIAEHFLNIENVRYTGIDIDGKAIDVAKERFAGKDNFRFFCESISSFKNNSDRLFDVVMIFGMLHHVEDSVAQELLPDVVSLLSERGRVVIYDLLEPEENGSLLAKIIVKHFERGRNLRKSSDFKELIQKSLPLDLVHYRVIPVTTCLGYPVASYFVEAVFT
ncbi:MAG: bifunctional 3-demethylubiquinone-9 3-methyltransferase/ 2-octaprenyl-6-hydroxy phenol methylase [Syntrophorhabdus sp. PtaB.Bin184]|nr:MAG: bifunctional 3-demethylubiquinone-9 3-methyltransferase/ 2-octaprenyl-6-hydroxy phenol methylase [Syntrophorhabdus sp. PtaB.Bin184]